MDIERDRNALLELWCENFTDPRRSNAATAGFIWFYEQNRPDVIRTWVALEAERRTVVGCATVYRTRRYVDGHGVGGAIATAMSVTQKHRTLAAALALQRALIGGSADMGAALVIGNPTRRSLPMCVRAGYSIIGDAFKWKTRLAPLAADMDPASLYSDEELRTIADLRFDRLWERASRRHGVLGDKSSGFLNWYNLQLSSLGYSYFCLVEPTSRELQAFVGFYPTDAGAFIADLMIESPEAPALEHVLSRFKLFGQRRGFRWIGLRYFGAPCAEQSLQTLGFQRKLEGDPVVIRADQTLSNSLRARLHDSTQWFALGTDLGS